MNSRLFLLIFILITTLTSRAVSQTDACANPNAPRIGLIISDKVSDVGSSEKPDEKVTSIANADIKFRNQLAKRLPARSCIVTSRDIFNDGKNYPQLKGSPIFEIQAVASTKHPGVFALAVTLIYTQGVYVQDQFRLFTHPIVIESDSDYGDGADDLVTYWRFMSAGLSHPDRK